MKSILLTISVFLMAFSSQSQCNIQANFNYQQVGDSIYFTNTSSNTTPLTSYSWNFGGLTSTNPNPVFNTSSFGGYVNVCQYLTDSSFFPTCYSSACDSIFITPDTTCNVQANLTYTVMGDSVIFTNTSTNEPLNSEQNWTINGVGYFGNTVSLVGGDSLGYYDVCLTVGFDFPNWCYDTYCDLVYAPTDSSNCNLQTNFTYNIVNDSIYFTNTSINQPNNSFYNWSINGLSYSSENLTLPYNDSIINVCYSIWSNSPTWCSDTLCQTITSIVDSCDFQVTIEYTVVGDSVQFYTNSTGSTVPTNFSWVIDGVSGGNNPTTTVLLNTFSPTYNVGVAFWDAAGNCEDSTYAFITVDTSSICNVQANFTYTVMGDSVIFTNTSTNEPLNSEQNWTINGVGYFGNTVSLVGGDSLGYYDVCLTVGFDFPNWCYDTYCNTIYAATDSINCNVQANFTYTVMGDSVIFTNTSTNEPLNSEQNWTINGVGYFGNRVSLVDGDSLGYYDVCLTVGFDFPNWCYDTYCNTIYAPTDSSLTVTQNVFSDLNIYPNPFNSKLIIENITNSNLIIYNYLGAVILRQNLTNSITEINTEYIPSGIYLIKILDLKTNNYSIEKFIKQ